MSEVTVTVGTRPIREVNREIQAALAEGYKVIVSDTRSRHNLGIGLPDGAQISFQGSVGYYCGGLNNGTEIDIERDAGWSVGEAMAKGKITVGGYSGMSVGASMRGGLIHVKGDTGPRCGVAMKGGNIIVEGKIGYLSGFMAHAGKIIALGGAGGACADSLWGGEVWVAGPIESLGVDTRVVDPLPEEIAGIDTLLAEVGINNTPDNWRKIVSAQRLWHFQSRDASAWLMI